MRKVHLHVDRRILKYLEILLRLLFSWLLIRRQWRVDINWLPVPLQGDFMIVARRAQKTGGLIRPVVKRMQCICRRNYGVPWPAPYPLFLTLVVDPTNRMLYEFYQLKKTGAGWQAAQASVFDLKSNKMRPEEWTSSDAA